MKKIKVGGKWSKVRRTVYPFEKVLGHYQVIVAKKFCKGKSLLDLGCGEGAITSQLSSNFSRIVGVDGTASQISLGRRKHPNIEFVHSTIEEYYPKEKFDCILFFFIIEHVDDPGSLIEYCKKFMHANTSLVITTINASSIKLTLRALLGREAVHHDHVAYYSYSTLCQLLNRHQSLPRQVGYFCYGTREKLAGILFDSLSSISPAIADGIIIISNKN